MISACMAISVCELRTAVREWACCLSPALTKTKHVLGTQKNRLNETVLLSTQNMLKLMG